MKFTYAAVLSASAALAQSVVEYVDIGVGPRPTGNDSSFNSDNADTTSSQTMPFSLYYPGDNAPTWQWRINLNVAEPDDSDVPNGRVLNTVYDFSFGADNLPQAVANNPAQLNATSFCVTVVESLFPAKVINKWDEDTLSNGSEESSCQKPLRKRCTDAIQRRWAESDFDENGCRGSDLNLAHVKECEWSFDGGYQASTFNLLGNQSRADNSSFPIQDSAGFFHITSPVYDGDNNTWVEQEQSRLHMIIIDSGNTYTPLCMRVDNSIKADSPATGANAGSVLSANSWLLLAGGFVALAYAL